MKLKDKINEIKNQIEKIDKQIDKDKWIAYDNKNARRNI